MELRNDYPTEKIMDFVKTCKILVAQKGSCENVDCRECPGFSQYNENKSCSQTFAQGVKDKDKDESVLINSLKFLEKYKDTKIIDNFKLIKTKISEFDLNECFYVIEIIKRRKDENLQSKSQKMLKYFEISNIEELEFLEPKIKKICYNENARAYIRLNYRSRKKVAFEMLVELSKRVSFEDYSTKNLYQSIVGRFHSDKNKKWVIDIDEEDCENIQETIIEIKKYIEILYEKAKKEDFVLYEVPTLNGIHIICSPFNLQEFTKVYKFAIHKDNPTLLFFHKNNLKE